MTLSRQNKWRVISAGNFSKVSANNCTFSNNSNLGAVKCLGNCTVTIKETIFSNNHLFPTPLMHLEGDILYYHIHALIEVGNNGFLFLLSPNLTNNTGHIISCHQFATLTVSHCLLTNNSNGTVVEVWEASAVMNDTTLAHNRLTSTRYAPVIVSLSSFYTHKCPFSYNVATNDSAVMSSYRSVVSMNTSVFVGNMNTLFLGVGSTFYIDSCQVFSLLSPPMQAQMIKASNRDTKRTDQTTTQLSVPQMLKATNHSQININMSILNGSVSVVAEVFTNLTLTNCTIIFSSFHPFQKLPPFIHSSIHSFVFWSHTDAQCIMCQSEKPKTFSTQNLIHSESESRVHLVHSHVILTGQDSPLFVNASLLKLHHCTFSFLHLRISLLHSTNLLFSTNSAVELFDVALFTVMNISIVLDKSNGSVSDLHFEISKSQPFFYTRIYFDATE